ncbi:DUF1232 domain-containing protein [Pilimelia terevasa]|uniref:DUF1232 domain-containing protein n=1 Tax=Pilimelia terevasa TaxID=53372 RepID=UPI001E4CBFE7|nr:YkvA family protein [Pilimelia terevasa]
MAETTAGAREPAITRVQCTAPVQPAGDGTETMAFDPGWWTAGCCWWWRAAAGLLLALSAIWLASAAALAILRPSARTLRDAARILPDLLRLLARLAADRSLPASIRLRLVLLLAYLASPVDLVPDFIPVLGHLDDVIVVVLLAVVRRAGLAALRGHWPGTDDGFAALARLCPGP